MEQVAAGRATVDVDPQQKPHPVGGRLRRRVVRDRLRCAQQAADMAKTFPFAPVGQQPVVPDPHEAVWQDVGEEAAEKLLDRQTGDVAAVAWDMTGHRATNPQSRKKEAWRTGRAQRCMTDSWLLPNRPYEPVFHQTASCQTGADVPPIIARGSPSPAPR